MGIKSKFGCVSEQILKISKKIDVSKSSCSSRAKSQKISKINENSNFVKIVNLAQKMLRSKYDGAEVMKIKKARCDFFDLSDRFRCLAHFLIFSLNFAVICHSTRYTKDIWTFPWLFASFWECQCGSVASDITSRQWIAETLWSK